MVRCHEGKLLYYVFSNVMAFSHQRTVQFDQLLTVALGNDSFTRSQEFLIHDTLLITPNAKHPLFR